MARWLETILLFFAISTVIASESEKNYEGFKVYDIKTKTEDDLKFLKDLEAFEGDERSLDFLSFHNNVGDVVRLTVMPSQQNYIENLLQSRNIEYKVKTGNLQE